MKVLHVISDQNIGGAGVLLCNLLSNLQKDVESTVVLPRGSLLEKRLSTLEVPLILLDHMPHRLSIRSVWELVGVIKKGSYDIVHSNASLSARVAARLCGKRSVHTRHCFYPVPKKCKSLLVKKANGMLSDAVIATSEVVVENLLEMGIPEKKIRVVINGAKAVRHVPEEELEGYRQKWGIGKDDFTVGICARLEACKGVDVFLRAAREVIAANESDRLRFLIAGDGSLSGELRSLASRLGVERHVIFTGFLPDTAPFYRLLSLNVNCSRGTETSCLAISEGMSAGVPTVATDYGGNPFMVGEDGAGFLFPVDHPHALAVIINELFHDPRLHREMQRKALERYRFCFTARRMAEETREVYRRLMHKKGL